MISYMQCIAHSIMVKEAISIMKLHGNEYRPQEVKMGGTEINFTNSQIIICHDELLVGHIETLYNLRCRMSVPEHLSYVTFYTETPDNNVGEARKRAQSLYTDTAEEIQLVQCSTEEEWDAVAFQLETMYNNKIASSLMLQPFCTHELNNLYPMHFRYKQYMHSDSWVDLPFVLIAKNIFEMSTRYIPE